MNYHQGTRSYHRINLPNYVKTVMNRFKTKCFVSFVTPINVHVNEYISIV